MGLDTVVLILLDTHSVAHHLHTHKEDATAGGDSDFFFFFFLLLLYVASLFLFQVKVLFVRNLANSVTEEILEKAFSQFGKLERVKKLKDYAFVHFEERDGAVKVRDLSELILQCSVWTQSSPSLL